MNKRSHIQLEEKFALTKLYVRSIVEAHTAYKRSTFNYLDMIGEYIS